MTPNIPRHSNHFPTNPLSDSIATGDSSRLGSVPSSPAAPTTPSTSEVLRRLPEWLSALPTPAPQTPTDLSQEQIRSQLQTARQGIGAATQALHEGGSGSGDLAAMSLMQAHDALAQLSASPEVGDHAVVERLRQRYFSALQELPAEVRARAGDGMMASLDHFEVDHADGSQTLLYSDHRIEVEAPSFVTIEEPIELDVPEGAHVEPGSTMSCERVDEETVVVGADGAVITTEPSVLCTILPPATE